MDENSLENGRTDTDETEHFPTNIPLPAIFVKPSRLIPPVKSKRRRTAVCSTGNRHGKIMEENLFFYPNGLAFP